MEKYYRVKEDNFMWSKGAIIRKDSDGYRSVNDIYNSVELKTEYISTHIIENPANERFFERVYKVDLLSRTVFKLKEEARALLDKEYKD